jgi:hypothetical protein
MDLTRRHLGPIFENIAEILPSAQLEQFEPWAIEQALRLRRAAQHGTASLSYEAELLREELMHLTPPKEFERMLTERTERMRLCQRQWLTGLLDFVDDLLDDHEISLLPWAA